MAGPGKPTLRVLKEIEDGEWHERDAVIRAAMPIVHPGLAYRTAENRRRQGLIKRLNLAAGDPIPERTRPATMQDIVASGARMVVGDLIHGYISRNKIEVRKGPGKDIFIRLTPGWWDASKQSGADDEEDSGESIPIPKAEAPKDTPKVAVIPTEPSSVGEPSEDPERQRIERIIGESQEIIGELWAKVDELTEENTQLRGDAEVALELASRLEIELVEVKVTRAAYNDLLDQVATLKTITDRQKHQLDLNRERIESLKADANLTAEQLETYRQKANKSNLDVMQYKGTISDLVRANGAQAVKIEKLESLVPYPANMRAMVVASDGRGRRAFIRTNRGQTEVSALAGFVIDWANQIERLYGQMGLEIPKQELPPGIVEGK